MEKADSQISPIANCVEIGTANPSALLEMLYGDNTNDEPIVSNQSEDINSNVDPLLNISDESDLVIIEEETHQTDGEDGHKDDDSENEIRSTIDSCGDDEQSENDDGENQNCETNDELNNLNENDDDKHKSVNESKGDEQEDDSETEDVLDLFDEVDFGLDLEEIGSPQINNNNNKSKMIGKSQTTPVSPKTLPKRAPVVKITMNNSNTVIKSVKNANAKRKADNHPKSNKQPTIPPTNAFVDKNAANIPPLMAIKVKTPVRTNVFARENSNQVARKSVKDRLGIRNGNLNAFASHSQSEPNQQIVAQPIVMGNGLSQIQNGISLLSARQPQSNQTVNVPNDNLYQQQFATVQANVPFVAVRSIPKPTQNADSFGFGSTSNICQPNQQNSQPNQRMAWQIVDENGQNQIQNGIILPLTTQQPQANQNVTNGKLYQQQITKAPFTLNAVNFQSTSSTSAQLPNQKQKSKSNATASTSNNREMTFKLTSYDTNPQWFEPLFGVLFDNTCRRFLWSGCQLGADCKFRHMMPEKTRFRATLDKYSEKDVVETYEEFFLRNNTIFQYYFQEFIDYFGAHGNVDKLRDMTNDCNKRSLQSFFPHLVKGFMQTGTRHLYHLALKNLINCLKQRNQKSTEQIVKLILHRDNNNVEHFYQFLKDIYCNSKQTFQFDVISVNRMLAICLEKPDKILDDLISKVCGQMPQTLLARVNQGLIADFVKQHHERQNVEAAEE